MMPDAPQPDQVIYKTRQKAVVILAVGQTICWAGLYYSFAALLLAWETDLGWAKTDLTVALTGALLISAMIAPMAGRIVDNDRGQDLLTGGALIGAGLLASLALIETRTAFVIIWLAIGLAQGACLYETCFAFMTRTLGANARPAIVTLTLIAGFASPLAFLSGAFLADALGWRLAVTIMATVVAGVGAPLHFLGAKLLTASAPGTTTSSPKDARSEEGPQALQRAIRTPAFWLIALAFPVMGLNHGLLLNHFIPLVVERGLTAPVAVSAAATIGPMQVIGRLMLMGPGRRLTTLTLTIISFAGVIASSSLLLFAGERTGLIFASAAIQGAAYGLVSILRPAVIAETLGREGFGVISGWLAVPYLAGFAFAPWIGALLWQWRGYDSALGVTAILGLLGLLAIAILAFRERRD